MPVPSSFGVGEPCWLDLVTVDPDAAIDFYGGLFGWTVESTPDEYGDYRNFVYNGRRIAGLTNPTREIDDGWLVYLSVTDTDATAAAIRDAGGELLQSQELPGLGRMLVARDATGARVGAWQSGAHPGFGLTREPGAPVWQELHAKDYAAAVAFYERVFGWETSVLSDDDELRFTTLGDDGRRAHAAGDRALPVDGVLRRRQRERERGAGHRARRRHARARGRHPIWTHGAGVRPRRHHVLHHAGGLMVTFRATVRLSGLTATGIEVPPEAMAALDAGQRVPVVATIHGYDFRTTVGPYRGHVMLPVSAEVRAGAGISAGEKVEVTLERDDQPREVELPEDLASALDADASARAAFDALSYSGKRAHVLAVEAAKTPDTRERRVSRIIETLHGVSA
jgi:predicted enzyme related to lactoylglutathione lyase